MSLWKKARGGRTVYAGGAERGVRGCARGVLDIIGAFGPAPFGPFGASIDLWNRTNRTSRTNRGRQGRRTIRRTLLNCAREDAARGRGGYAWPRSLP